MKSLVGQHYGKLTVLRRGEDYVFGNGHTTPRWECRCECGREALVRGTALTSGKTTSCGCARSDALVGKNVIDMVGQRFGSWTVIERHGLNGNHEAVWRCRCDCGNEREFTRRALVNGKRLRCKRCRSTNDDVGAIASRTKLIGLRFGRWVVTDFGGYQTSKGRTYRFWRCVCDCGTVRNVNEESLVRHRSTSCGCLRREAMASDVVNHLAGQQFGHLMVIERAENRHYPGGGQSQMYVCLCDCGNTTLVARSMLVSGQTQSCGCAHESRMEQMAASHLAHIGAHVVRQKTFDDLLSRKSSLLSYDFAIVRDDVVVGLIECQGEQHYRPVDYFGGDEKFANQLDNDARKRAYAVKHGIPLLELSYKLSQADFINQLDMFLDLLKSESRSDDTVCNERWSNGS